MTTLAQLRVLVAAQDLRDPDFQTFLAPDVDDMINAGIVEVGRLAPRRFQEDIVPVATQLSYPLQLANFPNGVPEIEVVRVEVWDGSQSPDLFLGNIEPADATYNGNSSSGWRVWGGNLELPGGTIRGMDFTNYVIKVWGYVPYPTVALDADVIPVSMELERAVRMYAKLEGLNRLVMDRDLFTQWQTRSNNSDVSPAALMNGINLAEEQWRRRARAIMVLRELPS